MITVTRTTRILVVEHDAIVARDIEESLQALGYEVVAVAFNAPDAFAHAREREPDVVLMNTRLPGPRDGIDAGVSIRSALDIPVVYITAQSDPDTLERAKAAGSWGYIVKPFDRSRLRAAIERSLDRHRAQKRLRTREARDRHLYRGDVWATFVLAGKGRIAECSDGFAALLGVGSPEGVEGRFLREFLPVPLEYEHLSSLARSAGRVLPHERSLRRVDGALVRVVMSLRGAEDGTILGSLVDLTEQRRVDASLEEARRAETVRRMAGGTAAAFSGPLTTILARVELLALEEGLSAGAREDAEEIRVAAGEIASLTHSLLAVAEGTLASPQAFSLGQAVQDLLPAVVEEVGPDVKVTLRLTEEPDGVEIDPLLLGRALMAIVFNARDAMDGPGRLTVSVGIGTVAPEDSMPLSGVEAGTYVTLAVRDDGPGMDDARRWAAVEPFFTTKPRRAGLGLSAARGIARQAGGWLSVDPVVGAGARVSLHLPRVRLG